MKNFKRSLRSIVAVAIVAGTSAVGPAMTHAATPVVETDHGAFVRIVGNPGDGTIKFQYGWQSSTSASDAAGYWIGVYDVTHSTYVWSSDTGPIDLPDYLNRNAHPTPDLANGDYKVVFFVRETYSGPVSNLAEIELPFEVNNSMM